MAKLKLMKKEWFNWFDKTFLDNITAWTEYYYINPDSQHWISNNLMDYFKLTIRAGTANGVNWTLREDGSVLLNGTLINNNLTLLIGGEVIINSIFEDGQTYVGKVFNITEIAYLQLYDAVNGVQSFDAPKTIVMPPRGVNQNFALILRYPAGTTLNNVIVYPVLVKGSQVPEKFNPHLIKIEDILGVAKLKDLNWAGSNGSYYVRVSDMKVESARSDKVFTTKYPSSTSSSHSFAHIFTESGYINVIYDSHPTLSEFKDYLGDEYVIYLKVDSPY